MKSRTGQVLSTVLGWTSRACRISSSVQLLPFRTLIGLQKDPCAPVLRGYDRSWAVSVRMYLLLRHFALLVPFERELRSVYVKTAQKHRSLSCVSNLPAHWKAQYLRRFFRFHEGFGPDVIAAVAFRLPGCFGVSPPRGLGPSVGPGQVRGRMWGRMEIRGVGAGPAVGIRRGEAFIPFAAPVVSSEAESPRPEPPRRLRGLPAARCAAQAGALLLSPFLGRQEKVSTSDFPDLFYE